VVLSPVISSPFPFSFTMNSPKPKNGQSKPKPKQSGQVPRKPRIAKKAFVPRAQAVPPIPGQNTILALSVVPDMNQLYSLAAAYVLKALEGGLPRSEAAQAHLALQTCFFAAMQNASNAIVSKAPRIYWVIENALRPKTVIHKGVRYAYSWNLDGLTPTSDPVYGGHIFGAETATVAGTGLYGISTTSTPAFGSIADAAAFLDNIWEYLPKNHPVMPKVNDFIFDAGLYGCKQAVSAQANPNDLGTSQYSRVESEVPIVSWLSYAALGTRVVGPSLVNRVYAFAEYVQGAPCNHVGLRLCYPETMSKAHVKTKMDFNFIDLGVVLAQSMLGLRNLNQRLIGASRPSANTTAPANAPTLYTTNGVSKNLMMLSKLGTCFTHFGPTASMWATTSGGLAAMAVGTNNIDGTSALGRHEWSWLMASLAQLKPRYSKRNSCFIVPVPTINQDAITFVWSFFPIVLPDDTTYGNANLDILNSNNGSGTVISLINGDTFRDDVLNVQRTDAAFSEVAPTASGMNSDKNAVLDTVENSVIIGVPLSKIIKETGAVRMWARFSGGMDNGLRNRAAYQAAVARRAERVQEARRRLQGGEALSSADRVMAANRINPDITEDSQIATISVVPVGADAVLQSSLLRPLQIPSANEAVDQLRIVHGCSAALKEGSVAQNAWLNNALNICDEFLMDPNSGTGSSVGAATLDLTKGLFESIVPGLGGRVDQALGGLGPEWGLGLKLGGAVVQGIRGAVQRGRARRLARRK